MDWAAAAIAINFAILARGAMRQLTFWLGYPVILLAASFLLFDGGWVGAGLAATAAVGAAWMRPEVSLRSIAFYGRLGGLDYWLLLAGATLAIGAWVTLAVYPER
jgi:Flp pilus assembly protein protease CpaA